MPLLRCCLSSCHLCLLISHHSFICSPAAILPARSSCDLVVPALVPFTPPHLFPPCSPPASPSISRLSCPTSLTPRIIHLPQCICRQQDGQPGRCFSRYCSRPVVPRSLSALLSQARAFGPGLRHLMCAVFLRVSFRPAAVEGSPMCASPGSCGRSQPLRWGRARRFQTTEHQAMRLSCAWLWDAPCACLASPPAVPCSGARGALPAREHQGQACRAVPASSSASRWGGSTCHKGSSHCCQHQGLGYQCLDRFWGPGSPLREAKSCLLQADDKSQHRGLR